jgi:DNA polymerase-3 subunit epsilon
MFDKLNKEYDFLKTPVTKANFCVVDVETTGLSALKNRIIEIGIVKISQMKITDKFHSFINPRTSIPAFITSLTGISDEDVADAPAFDDIVFKVRDFISDNLIVGHNLSFDIGFINHEFLLSGVEPPASHQICTLKLSRNLFPDLKSKSLNSVSSHLRIRNESAHRALADAETTAKIFLKISKKIKTNNKSLLISDLINLQNVNQVKSQVLARKPKLENDLLSVPNNPGIYFFLNSKNEIIYVGKAKSLRDRVKSYFTLNASRKAKKIINQAARVKVEVTNTELTALLTEAEAIKILNPKYNSFLKDYGSKYFIVVNKNKAFSDLAISNNFNFDGNDYFGLFLSRRKAAKLVEIINKTFQLRECSDKELEKGKACFLHEIERCTAPCINNDNQKYSLELERVYDFLYGKNQFALNRMLIKMKEFSARQKFEKAAEVKQTVDSILSQINKSALLSEPVNRARVLFRIEGKFENDFILMIDGKIYIKKYSLSSGDKFETAINDYYEGVISRTNFPDEEDLEKMKISLNWLTRNRERVKAFYLRDYKSKNELFSALSKNDFSKNDYYQGVYDVKELTRILS